MPLRRPHRRARLGRVGRAAALALVLAVGGCAGDDPPPRRPAGGVVHVVQPGETLWRISKRYGTELDELVRANRIRDVTDVPVGTRLWIPQPDDPSGSRVVPPPAAIAPSASQITAEADRAVREFGLAFAWPVRGTLNSRFGGRRGKGHEGVDIGAPKGSLVRASEAGKVIFADDLGDYGNVVIVKHVGDLSSVYAHNRRNRVRRGQFVEKGDVLAEVGTSGNASGPHVHFEIRQGQTPVDPLRYLP